jgi:hypothetical protein
MKCLKCVGTVCVCVCVCLTAESIRREPVQLYISDASQQHTPHREPAPVRQTSLLTAAATASAATTIGTVPFIFKRYDPDAD